VLAAGLRLFGVASVAEFRVSDVMRAHFTE
jgi:hypothetical protein